MKNRKQSLGEFELIQRITKEFPHFTNDVIVGIGDDCAVLENDDKTYTLVTCDGQIADVHFFSQSTRPEAIGRKAMAVNISDIAAMGGKPTFCLVSLIVPQSIGDKYVESVYKGLNHVSKQYGITLIGGNTSSGGQFVIDIFLLGEVNKSELLLRSGAKEGDKVLVTGTLGDAAAGLAVLQNLGLELTQNEKQIVITKQHTPTPRLAESTILATSQKVTSMIDISDGLSSDMLHLCEQSNTGVVLYENQLPLTVTTRKIANLLRKEPLEFALSGGEDYELLFTAHPDVIDTLIDKVQEETGTPVTVIGEILPKGKGEWLQKSNREKIKLAATGWDHRKDY